jgi:hypothetical protein
MCGFKHCFLLITYLLLLAAQAVAVAAVAAVALQHGKYQKRGVKTLQTLTIKVGHARSISTP